MRHSSIRSQIVVGVAIVLCILFQSNRLFARPEYALMRGEVSCMGCHVNPTGGELRSAGGESYEINQLPMWNRGDKFSGNIGNSIRIGMDFRSQYLSFTDAASYPQDKLGPAHTNTTSLETFQAMALPISISAQLTKSFLVCGKMDILNLSTGSGNYGYEAYGLLHFVHSSGELIQSGDVVGDAYVKAGTFEPAFGIRFDDHTIYTRGGDGAISQFGADGLFWKPNYHDVGVELGTTLFDHIGLTVGYFDGLEYLQDVNANYGDTTNKMALVVRGVFATEIIENMLSVEIGGSYYNHPHLASGTNPALSTTMSAVHGGIRVGPVTIMSEYDMVKFLPTLLQGQYLTKANAFVCEADVHFVKGFSGFVRYDSYHDNDSNAVIGTEVKGRYAVGFEWFPIRFLELRPEFRVAKLDDPNGGVPTNNQHTETTFLVQSHVFF